jgi:radical SAM protein with 4Fe4S-binding SPASM domain
MELMLEAKRHGLKVTQDTAHTTPCMFSSHHGVIIGPEGNIYKCISLVGRPEFKVGTVFAEEYDAQEYGKQMDISKRISQCYEETCPYIPVCAGGCAYESVVRTGRYDLRYCTRQKLEAFYYKRYLLRYQKQLEALGMRPLSAQELQTTAVPAPSPVSSAHLVPLQSIRRRPSAVSDPLQ